MTRGKYKIYVWSHANQWEMFHEMVHGTLAMLNLSQNVDGLLNGRPVISRIFTTLYSIIISTLYV